VVVGYTRLDEGEFIGEFASASLNDLFPGEDDRALVERFTADIAQERAIQPPAHAAPSVAAGGFAVGGDRTSLRLHDDDVALIRSVAEANPSTVVAIVAGSAVIISEWGDQVPAVAVSWYSGMEGGHGLASVLCGTADATGRLPFSVPREESDLPAFNPDAEEFTYDGGHGYWHLAEHGTTPGYPFGFGLSYTTFELVGAEVTIGDGGGAMQVHASVRNTGSRAGSDVVQVYGRRLESGRPERLLGFGRIELGAGVTGPVDITVLPAALAERDVTSHTMVVRSGRWALRVARHATDPGIVLETDVGPPPVEG
jgi:beta-glucosidase